MRIRFVGHATVSLEDNGHVLVTDPVLRRRVAFLRSAAVEREPAGAKPVVSVVSHLHRDHCDIPSLRSLGPELTLVVPGGTADFFRRRGFRRVIALNPGESGTAGGFTVTATEAEHDGRRWPIGAHRAAVGFLIEVAGSRVYFAGDTDLFDGMARLAGPDVALLPVWGWGRSIGAGHLDPKRAARATEVIRPGLAVPIHWGSLRPMWHRRTSVADLSSPAQQFADDVRSRHLSTRVEVLMPGDCIDWPG